MLSANFKPKRIAAASRGFLAIARLSCFHTGLGLGFLQEDLDSDLDLRTVDLDLHLDLAVAGLVTSLNSRL